MFIKSVLESINSISLHHVVWQAYFVELWLKVV